MTLFCKICNDFYNCFSVDVVRRKAVAIAMKHLQIQSFVTGKFSSFFMTFTTIYIEIDPTRIYCYNIRNLVQNFLKNVLEFLAIEDCDILEVYINS